MSRAVSPTSTTSTPDLFTSSASSTAPSPSSFPYTPPRAFPFLITLPSRPKSHRIPRKPVPQLHPLSEMVLSDASSSSSLSEDDEDDLEMREERRCQQRRARTPEVVDGLWTSTCDERYDEPVPSWSHNHSIESAYGYGMPDYDPPLSPRFPRLAAFTHTVSHFVDGPNSKPSGRGRSSFDMPDLELPWLPTLFPNSATPLVQLDDSGFHKVGVAPPSPALSGSTCYPDSSSSSDAGNCSSDTASTLAVSITPATKRKNLFRVEAAGRQIVIDASSPLSAHSGTSPSPKWEGQALSQSQVVEEYGDDDDDVLVITLSRKSV
ncbi:hypothetical protein JCM1841_001478 [Sporobolomyces salmonicolor]